MKADKEKISTYQLMLLFIMSTFSPAIRIFPSLTAQDAKQAAWLTPIVSVAAMLILVFIAQSFFKKSKKSNLSDVYMKVLGGIPGRIVVFIYLIYIILLQGIYTRYYAERIVSSILPDTSIHFFILVMMCLVLYVLRGGLVPFARITEFLYYIFMVVIAVTGILSLSNVEITNLLPLSYIDIIPVLKSTKVILSVWSYFIFMFFFADKVNDKEHIKKLGTKAIITVAAVSTWIIIITVGVLGSSLTSRVPLPFFITVKQISVLDSLERLESIALSLWVAADFIIITFFGYLSLCILKSLFRLSGTKSLASPLVIITYFISIAIAKNRFELERASETIFIKTNLILGFGIPIVVFIIGKIRGVIGAPRKR